MIKTTKIILTISFFLFNIVTAQELMVFGDITGISNNVWRGISQGEGPAIQSTMGFSYKTFYSGIWVTSVTYGDGTTMETDPFMGINLSIKNIEATIGITYYSYDFKKFNAYAKGEYELFLKMNHDNYCIKTFYIPKQNSTRGDLKDSAYWISLSVEKPLKTINLGLNFEYGTYSSRFLYESLNNPVGYFNFYLSKSVKSDISICWNYLIPTNSEMNEILLISCIITY